MGSLKRLAMTAKRRPAPRGEPENSVTDCLTAYLLVGFSTSQSLNKATS
jgi:hypothetical protein